MEILNRVYAKSPEVITRKIGDCVVVIPTESDIESKEEDSVFSFNDMAAGIWVQIDGLASLENIKEKIVEYFEIDSDLVKKDLIDFVLQLEEAGLIYLNKAE